jgi:hypothetical protein
MAKKRRGTPRRSASAKPKPSGKKPLSAAPKQPATPAPKKKQVKASADANVSAAPATAAGPKSSASAKPETSSPKALVPWVLVGLVIIPIFLTLVSLPVSAKIYLNILPENWKLRAAAHWEEGDAEKALNILFDETELNVYNFEAFYQAAEYAAFAESTNHCQRALDGLLTAFMRFRAVRGRDVYSQSWNEARGLSLMALCLGRLERFQEAALLAASASAADPARTTLLLQRWRQKFPELLQQMQRQAPPAKPEDFAPPSNSILLWDAATTGALELLNSQPGAEMPAARYERTDNDERWLALVRKSQFILPQSTSGSDLSGNTSVRVFLEACGVDSFGLFPLVILGTPTERNSWSFGAASIVKSKTGAVYELGPFKVSDDLPQLIYYNDEYDPDLKQDRNLYLRKIWVAPAE